MLRLLMLLGSGRPRGRLVLSIAGIALGVALGYGVQLVNGTAVDSLSAAVRALAGQADLEVRGGRDGFRETLYPELARVPGVAVASPGLELDAALAGGGRIRLVGVDVLRAALIQPRLFLGHRLALLEPDTVLLSAQAARRLGRKRLRLVAGSHVVTLKVAGVLPTSALEGVAALADLSTVQWRLGRLGTINRLDLRLAEGADREAVRRRVAALLPPGVYVAPVRTLERESGYPSRAYRVNLDVLALVALFTGGFLVFSAQTLETARRRREHALLRVLGLSRGALARLVLLEAGAAGAIGAAIGLALGCGFAWVALRASGGDLGAGLFGGATRLRFSAGPAAIYFLAGIAIAVLGAALPARDAARTPAARALKAGDEQRMFERAARLWPGLALLAAAAALSQLGPVGGLPLFGYASIACVLVGAIALMPRVSAALFAAAPLPRRPPLALALAQLRGAPGQAAVSLAAIVASFSLMAAMAIMVASFRHSLQDWLDAVLPADLYLRTVGDTAYVGSGLRAGVRALPQLARVDFMRTAAVLLDPARPPLVLIARDHAARAYPMVSGSCRPTPGGPPPIWASEAARDLYGLAPGRRVELPLGGRIRRFIVCGIFRDYARQHGALLLERSEYVALTGDRRASDAAMWLARGASAAQAMDAIRALPGAAALEIAAPGDIRRRSLAVFDRSFAVTYALEAVAVVVGLIGLSSSLGAVVLARRRELGMLRHLGLTRGQIGAMLAAEGGLLAALGAAAGLIAGGAISLVLVYVVNRQSFNWSISLHVPWAFLAALTGVLFALAMLTAWLTGREATGMGPIRAVKEDW